MSSEKYIVAITGTRPEVIKMAPILMELRRRNIKYYWIHTNQHKLFDMKLSLFIEQTIEVYPNCVLPYVEDTAAVGSPKRTFGRILNTIITELRNGCGIYLDREHTACIVAQGDTASVLAAALFARTAGIPFAHVEAGLRSFDLTTPEEVIRTTVDQISDMMFVTTRFGLSYLSNETRDSTGDPTHFVRVGNTLADVVAHFTDVVEIPPPPDWYNADSDRPLVLATVHRRENIYSPERLHNITQLLCALGDSGATVVFPVHPHTLKRFKRSAPDISRLADIKLIDPLPFDEFLNLERLADVIVTDSGGVQEEAYLVETPCFTLRDSTERPETLEAGVNELIDVTDVFSAFSIARKILITAEEHHHFPPGMYGDGYSGKLIVDALIERWF